MTTNGAKLTYWKVVDFQLKHYVEIYRPLLEGAIYPFAIENGYDVTIYLNNDLRKKYGKNKISLDEDIEEMVEDELFAEVDKEIKKIYYLGYDLDLEVPPYCGVGGTATSLEGCIHDIISNGSLNIMIIEADEYGELYFLLATHDEEGLTDYTLEEIMESVEYV